MEGPKRRKFCMYSCGRRTVYSNPESSRVRSAWACRRMSATGLSGPAPLAESFTILSTPARVAASMSAPSIDGCLGSSRDMRNMRSTPSSASHAALRDGFGLRGPGSLRAGATERAGAGGERLRGGVRPRVLPLAGLLFQAAILGFPLIAGWIIASLDYPALFAVLVTFALVQAAIGWWRFSVARRAMNAEEAPQP